MSANKKLAPWIVVTGLDGSGKTSLVNRLEKYLPGRTYSFHLPNSNFVNSLLKVSGEGSPMSDPLTDRLIFSLDARLTNYNIREWRKSFDYLLSGRGWMDNYIHGATQGYRYQDTSKMLGINELEKPSTVIYLVADPSVAYERIKNDSNKDKFETSGYMRDQYAQTVLFYKSIKRNKHLEFFSNIPSVLVDTTNLSIGEVFQEATVFLDKIFNFQKIPNE